MTKHKNKGETIYKMDLARPPGCPNFGTRRKCGGPAALESGCDMGLCKENRAIVQQFAQQREEKAKEREEKAAQAPKRGATPRMLSRNIDAYLDAEARKNAVRTKGTREGNWVWHTEECCSRVWRPVAAGCVPVASRPAG